MSTPTQTMTAEQLLKLPRGEFRYELVKGELRTMSPTGGEHGRVTGRITVRLGSYIENNDLGVYFGAETGFKIASDPDTVRAPGFSFISHGRIPEGGITKKFISGAPDLAVEVLSPGDSYNEVLTKVGEWLTAGTRAVWIVSPENRSVIVYRSLMEAPIFSEADELDGGEVVPGFRCRVNEIFV